MYMKKILIFILVLLFLLIYAYGSKIFTDYSSKTTTLDDASPVTVAPSQLELFLKEHEKENLVIFVTPFYEEKTNLTGNKEWVENITELQKEYNFTIGLHGYSHKFLQSYCDEFLFPNPGRIRAAREEFKNAFGYYPKVFRAPCFELDIFDYIYIKLLGMKNYGWLNKGDVYHPKDLPAA